MMCFKKFWSLCILLFCTSIVLAQNEAGDLAQAQLEAYNNRDIDAFLIPYSDSVKVYNFPNQLLFEGKDTMRERYAPMFSQMKDLHCSLVNRMINGNVVIDQESVLFQQGQPLVRVFAIYKIRNHKIQEVYFLRSEE